MSKPGISNLGAGKALLHTKLNFVLQAFSFCFLVGFVLPVILINSISFYVATPLQRSVALLSLDARLTSQSVVKRWTVTGNDGVKRILVASDQSGQKYDLLNPAQMQSVASPLFSEEGSIGSVFVGSLGFCLMSFFGVLYWIRRYGKKNMESTRLRGALPLVKLPELNRLVRLSGASRYYFAGARLPNFAPMQGIIASGAQGFGKSMALHDLMQQVFNARGRKSVVYDPSGEFYRAYYRPGKDYFFNPALIGSVPWSIFSELKYSYDTDTLANSFLPPNDNHGSGANKFFEDAARALFSVILLRLAQRGVTFTADIASAFLEMPEEEMALLIQKSVASSAVGGDSKTQRQGVISSIAIYLNGIAAVNRGKWSISKFLNDGTDSRLFILGTDDTQAMFAPLYRLMLSIAFDLIAAKQQVVHSDKYWFFLDELPKLGEIRIDERLATLRKYGVCIAAGIQAESQLSTIIGEARTQTVLNVFNNYLQLRVNDADIAKKAAVRLGSMEVNQVNHNQQLGISSWRDGSGLSYSERDKTIVHPSDLMSLGICKGYIKVAGEFPRAAVNYDSWRNREWFGLCRPRMDSFSAVQENPARDPSFVIRKDLPEGVFDTELAGVRADLQKEVAATKEARAEKVISTEIKVGQPSQDLGMLDNRQGLSEDRERKGGFLG